MSAKTVNRGGIKTEAVGRYYLHGEIVNELSREIIEKTNHFLVLYEYDYDVHKMVTLAHEMREKAEKLAVFTQWIADSSPKEAEE